VDLRKIWDSRAAPWIKWARTPWHDAYWYYAAQFFDNVGPSSGDRALEIGCGEGRVTRDLLRRGHAVVAIDSSPTVVFSAREVSSAAHYVLADATHLPFLSETFDSVVAYNSLQDVNEMPAAVDEASRVLRPTGSLCICIVHPLRDAGRFKTDDDDAEFIISTSYFERRIYEETFQRDGLEMTFTSWRYPFEDYSRAFEDAGLLIERVREPLPNAEATARQPRWKRSERVPMFLFVRAIKHADT
jgi:SAM-dependent methyltransferase